LTKPKTFSFLISALLLEYLGTSGGCQSARKSRTARDTADIGCERFSKGGEQRLFSVAAVTGLEVASSLGVFTHELQQSGNEIDLIYFATRVAAWLVLGMVVGRGVKKFDLSAIIGSKKTTTTDRQESQVSIIAQEKEVHQRLEDLFVRSSSEIVDSVENFAIQARKAKEERINSLSHQITNADREQQDSYEYVQKEVELLTLLSEYVQEYWSLAGAENRKDFCQIACLLFKLVKEIQREGNLDGYLFELYEQAVYRYINSVCQVLRKENLNLYLCELEFFSKDGEGDVDSKSTIVRYPDTAEDKAVVRMKDINNEEDWIELPKSKKKITPEKIRQHMKKRGYT
jgi:hypothetical protein